MLFAFKDKSNEEVETLVDHLVGVAYYAYLITSNIQNNLIRYSSLLAGLLHDVGKALDVYQRCLLSSKYGDCSYIGHEVFSKLIAFRILEKTEIETKIKAYTIYAIMHHHQARGGPVEGIHEFIRRVKRKGVDILVTGGTLEQLSIELVEAVNKLRSRISHKTSTDNYLHDVLTEIELSIKSLERDTLVEIINRSMNNANFLEREASGLSRELDRALEDYADLLRAKLVTGIVILADYYTASMNRVKDSRQRGLLCRMLESYIKHLEGSLDICH